MKRIELQRREKKEAIVQVPRPESMKNHQMTCPTGRREEEYRDQREKIVMVCLEHAAGWDSGQQKGEREMIGQVDTTHSRQSSSKQQLTKRGGR